MILTLTLLLLISISFTTLISIHFKSIYINNYHIHHWIWGLILYIISLFYDNVYISTIFLGITSQGLLYKDKFVI